MASNFSASIPASEMQAANDVLNNTAQTPGKKSHGPKLLGLKERRQDQKSVV